MNNKNKLALVAINSKSSHTNLALFYIKKILNKNHAMSHLIELTINENWKDTLEKLTDEDFDYYLFSIYIWNAHYVETIVTILKKIRPLAKIILGGPEITYNLAHWEKLNIADILVKGQAEDYAENILDCSKGIYHSKFTPINEVPFPYELEDYHLLKGRLIYYEASRGCLFDCSYCLSSCSEQNLEYRSLDLVKKEMVELTKIEPKIVKMVDRTFNSNIKFARSLWTFLIELNSSIPFHFEIHPLFLEEEDFLILEKAPSDLFHFEVGIQSTDREVLTAVDRPYNWDKEKKNIKRLCSMTNIHTHLDQIIALPKDSKEKAINSFNEILNLKPDEFQLGFLKIIKGTKLSTEQTQHKMIVNPSAPYEVLETSHFPFSEIRQFYIVESNLNRYYNNHYFKETIEYLMDNCPSPWSFFSRLEEFSPSDKSVKRWPVLAYSLLEYANKFYNDDLDYIIDLLRLDWCPYASGQNYPSFLQLNDKEEIKAIRKNIYRQCDENIDQFERRDFNRSILFVPKTNKLYKKKGNKLILFYRSEKTIPLLIDYDPFTDEQGASLPLAD